MTRNSGNRKTKDGSPSNLAAQTDTILTNQFALNFHWIVKDSDFDKLKKNSRLMKQFLNWIEKLSKLTWHEINNQPRQKLGSEPINYSSLKTSPPAEFDRDDIISFHWYEHRSIVGVRIENTFCPYSIELDAGQNKNYKHG